jgi:hypothetical protein
LRPDCISKDRLDTSNDPLFSSLDVRSIDDRGAYDEVDGLLPEPAGWDAPGA